MILTEAFLILLLAATVRMATPYTLTALGEIFSQRSGVLNLGLEGMMLAGAFGSFMGMAYTGSAWLGVLIGVLAGGLMGLIHAFLSITLRVNQVISGIGINILSLGLVGFFFRVAFGVFGTPPTISGLGTTEIPILSQIPVVGTILFKQNILVYVTLILVFLCAIVLFRTTYGLRIRAVGENPRAADTVGVNVNRVRYLCVIFGGLMAGLGGTVLIMSVPGQTFKEYIIGGRGWIAVALVIFAKWLPYRAFGGALLFGGLDALQLRLQAMGVAIPYRFLLVLPALLTLIILIIVSRKASGPASLCVPYKRGEE